MHYAVPRILQRSRRLERLYTDFYTGSGVRKLISWTPRAWRPSVINRLAGRFNAELPDQRVRAYQSLGLAYYFQRRWGANGREPSAVYLRASKKFCELVVRDGFGSAGAVYTFNTAALEILRAAKCQNLVTVVEQTIAPRALEEKILAEENNAFPHCEPRPENGAAVRETIEREAAEWKLSDVIVCGSEFVRQGVIDCGGPGEKCVVVPYGVDFRFETKPRSPHTGPLRVLSVGAAGLRKGVFYAEATARAVGKEAEFRWVGPVNITAAARQRVGSSVSLIGAVPSSTILSHFEWADVFFLPSVCEGSATATYEALVSGLPVVTTPNTGSIVVDGVNGFIVPARNVSEMAKSIRLLSNDRLLLRGMQTAARGSIDAASLDAYERRLLAALPW